MQVVEAAQSIVNSRDTVHMTRGRKVVEIRPWVDWDKGKALLHLLRALGLDESDDVIPLYIGDDVTDEDAFKVIKGRGVGVLVSTRVKPTAAEFVLRDPDEVRFFVIWPPACGVPYHATSCSFTCTRPAAGAQRV